MRSCFARASVHAITSRSSSLLSSCSALPPSIFSRYALATNGFSMQRIYDTRERSKVELQLREPGKVGIYACGVTVYDLCHVGHARTLVAFDIIARHLRRSGVEVRLVRNITDVDDKIIRRGHAEGKTAAEVARFYADAMAADMAALGVTVPDAEPRATEHIPDMIEVIRRLEERGLAYAAEG